MRAFGLQHDGQRTVAKLATWPRLTDDRGRYRLFGLPRGSYLIVASIDAAERPPRAVRARRDSHRCTTRALRTSSPRSRCKSSSDGAIAGVDLAVAVTSTVRVAGTALNSSGNPLRRSRVAWREPSLGQRGARAASRAGRTRGCVRALGRAARRLRPAGPGRAWSRHARRVRRRVHHCRRERPAADDDQDVARRDARGPLRRRGPIEPAHACAIDSRRADGHRFGSTGWSWTSRPGRARRWPVLSHGTLRTDAADVSCAAGAVS